MVKAPVTAPAKAKRSWRWVRAVAPFVVLAAIYTMTAVAHVADTPDLRDPGTMSPTGTGPDGSSRLAAQLAARGVTIVPVTSASLAFTALTTGDATVFVPAPDLLNPSFAERVAALPGRHRVVLVEPGFRTTIGWRFDIRLDYPTRWATGTQLPDCRDPVADQAGRASVRHLRYAVDQPTRDCYHRALVAVRAGDTEVVAVGASDPFRNSRIDEYGNALLATGLLTGYTRLIWVDVHRREPTPATPPPSLGAPDYDQPDRSRSGTNPMWRAFPAWLWAALVLALGVATASAFVGARRLGPPVAEPLPVLVPAAETVTGRGRLYDRARARPATLQTLRAAAITRLNALVNPVGATGPPLTAEELTALVAQRVHLPPATVRAILYDPLPDPDDDDLARAVARLDHLSDTVAARHPRTVQSGGTP